MGQGVGERNICLREALACKQKLPHKMMLVASAAVITSAPILIRPDGHRQVEPTYKNSQYLHAAATSC